MSSLGLITLALFCCQRSGAQVYWEKKKKSEFHTKTGFFQPERPHGQLWSADSLWAWLVFTKKVNLTRRIRTADTAVRMTSMWSFAIYSARSHQRLFAEMIRVSAIWNKTHLSFFFCRVLWNWYKDRFLLIHWVTLIRQYHIHAHSHHMAACLHIWTWCDATLRQHFALPHIRLEANAERFYVTPSTCF